ncbi:putative lipid II flippase FtsW [Paenibacillus allorhizosphaerae]|uniref:Probable peptidoglycan glycosyltransferase FtsW n=1 Tax=Paenibacillus allorhizosphaerae TaxID=2849866 RepID=A0ABM8VCA6_9BACL|nr:putative lipid II flippase FtsW [Paenibacillus allorhizosphaerae]CAG7622658.1 putative peptidoglycan glycosyltransferase FtsW [Paenibacillus allorhizosphaerae]
MTSQRRGTPDFLLLFLTFSLVCFGLAFVFSAGMAYKPSNPWYLAIRQSISIGMGTVAMFFCMNVDYRKYQKWIAPFFAGVVGLLFLVPLIGKEVNGAKSWFYIGSFGLQPTEFAKLAVIIYLAVIISKKGERIREFKRGLVPPLLVICFVCGLIMLQNDLGSTMILVLVAVLMLIIGGASLKHIFILGSVFACLGALAVSVYLLNAGTNNYRVGRITAFLNPWSDPDHSGFQLIQSLYAFGHGGLTGAGFGQSIQKLHYLPEAHNDFIFSIIGEELGFIGTSFFLLIYLAFLWRGIIIALRCQDVFGTLAGIGIVSMIGIQAFINIGGVTNSIPMTGVTLPLISYGGTSMLVTLMGLGILLSISREQNKPEKEPTKKRA